VTPEANARDQSGIGSDTSFNPNPRIRSFFVALLDVLGQRRQLVPHCGPFLTEDEVLKAHKATEDAVQPIYWIRNSINLLLKENASVISELESAFIGFRAQTPQCQRFADTTVLYSALSPEGSTPNLQMPEMPGVYLGLVNCARLFLQGMAKRWPLRGAIEVGVGTDLFPGEVYGPVLLAAHHLESALASYPRVIIGPELIRMLDWRRRLSANDPNTATERRFVELAWSLVTKDDDDEYVLNYLSDTLRELAGPGFASTVGVALSFAVAQKQHHLLSGDAALAAKYNRLLRFFASHGFAAADQSR
jgi:hypothetical protein